MLRKENTICFEGLNKEKRYLPVEDAEELMIFGEVSFNKRFLEFCSQKGILIHIFSHNENYQGSYYPRERLSSGYLLLKQAEHYLDEPKRLRIAQSIVEGSLKNMLRVLKYYQTRGKELTDNIETIESLIAEIGSVFSIQSLMAIEGNAREAYYMAFDKIIEKPEFSFNRRTRQPPRNEVNALISFGNAILYSVCLSEIYNTHLDPRIGFLHATNLRRFTLNLDIAEIFKPIIVDRSIFSLIGKGMLKDSDFKKESGGTILKDTARKAFVIHLEEKLRTTIEHKELGRPISYRRLIRLELYKIEKHLMDEKSYTPFVASW